MTEALVEEIDTALKEKVEKNVAIASKRNQMKALNISLDHEW